MVTQEQKLENKLISVTFYTLYGILITYPLIFLSIYAYQLGGIIAAASIYIASSLAMGITPLVVAPLSDKTGYRLKYAILAILFGSVILFTSTFIHETLLIILLLILGSAILQIGQPLFISYETERQPLVGKSVGNVFLYINLGYFIGSIIFGYTIEIISFTLASLSISLVGIIVSLLFINLKENRIIRNGSNNFSFYRFVRSIDKNIILSSSLVFSPSLVYSIVPVYYTTFLKGGILDWGIVNALSTLVGIFASPYVGKLIDSIGIKKVLAIGCTYYPIYYASIMIFPNTIFFAIIYTLPFWLFIWIPLFALPAINISNNERATRVSSMNFSINVFRALGGTAGGTLYYIMGPNYFMLSSTLISILIPIIALHTLRIKR